MEPKSSMIDVQHVGLEFSPRGSSPGSAERDPFVALKDANLQIPRGQFVALVGASGCGKTSLLNMIAGMLKPTSGTVRVAGEPARTPNPRIGYMFARDALFPWRTALKNVEVGLESRSEVSKAERRRRARQMLQMVGLADVEGLFRSQLSQGMRQRVAIARTLALDPDILLLDEPFAALDARTKLHIQMQFLDILDRMPADNKKTVVFVTHDLQEAILLADRIIVMLPKPGRIVHDQIVALPPTASHEEAMFTEEFRILHRQLFELLEGDHARL